MSNYNVSLFLSSVLLALSFSVFSSPFVYWFLSASSDEGRWVQMKGILPSHSSAALLVIWILLRHSAPQICHSTLQWMALCYVSGCRRVCVCVCVCAQRACEDGGRCVLLSYVILAAVKVTLDFSQTHPYSCGKQAECLICTEDQKAFMKHTTFRTFSISDGASASVLSYIQASHTRVSVCLRGTEQTECDRGIF